MKAHLIPMTERQMAKAQATRHAAWDALDNIYPMSAEDCALVAAGAIENLYAGFNAAYDLNHIAHEAAHFTALYLMNKRAYSPAVWTAINDALGRDAEPRVEERT